MNKRLTNATSLCPDSNPVMPFAELCLLFVYMRLLQREMEEIKDDWNQRRIRLQKKTDKPNGVPNDLMTSQKKKEGGQITALSHKE